MAEENVKVAVRVRPFNQREKDAKSKLVVGMTGNTTIITNPKTNEEKKYAFDFSYWSHDAFKTESNGYLSPDGAKYADQKKVYNDLGVGILKNAWNGFNASLFAYGQTGSGKSYSVVGYGENKGIVPMVCEAIFKEQTTQGAGKQIEVTFSMLEIYSEIVRDLLNSKGDKKVGLQVREDPKIGFYAQGQTKTLVGSFADITRLMDEGNANRTIAATNMNATSSRAHTIVTISLVQKYKNDAGKEMAKSSLMNLVDLAGSERADQTGATGDRLKEGAAINLSLTALGNVISALADNSQGKNVKVPYRDSQLTKLLMNALGGNSKTIMIAAISPADINFDESLSTLRYADRAKQIKTKATVNEDPTEKLIKDLKDENARLKKLLEDSKVDPNAIKNASGGAGGAAAGAAGGKVDDNDAEEEALRKQLEENDKKMKEMQQSYEEKLANAHVNMQNMNQSKILEKAKTTPHLRNVNMDPSLSGTVKLLLEGEGTKIIGQKGSKADIQLDGIGILEKHAGITNKGGKFTIERFGDAKVLRNGVILTSPCDLNHLDRLVFGTSQYFVFQDPAKVTANQPYYDFQAMQDEIGKASGIVSSSKNNMTQEEIQCQAELVDLLPAIEEANMISIALDKRVMFSVLPVSAEARGEYDGKFKAFVTVKNFANGLEWIWTKEKFLGRKVDLTEVYNDYKQDGKINTEKFKNYDPFYESPDTPTQVGTAIVLPKSFAYLISQKTDCKILSLHSKEAGQLSIEILPCSADGKVIPENSGIIIKDPKVDLLNKSVNFIIKINAVKNLNSIYEDVFCQFKFYNDPTLYKTEVIKGDKDGFNFKFTKQFTFTADQKFLDFVLNKCLYIQVWSEQKHPKKNSANEKVTTQDYFDRIKNSVVSMVLGNEVLNNMVDPENQRLKDDLKIANINNKKKDVMITNIQRLTQVAGKNPIYAATIDKIMAAKSEAEVNTIISEYSKSNSNGKPGSGTQHHEISKSQACNIL